MQALKTPYCLPSYYIPGTSLGIMTGMNTRLATTLSSAIAILYTAYGQILAVVYTDILQLLLIVVGLVSIHFQKSIQFMTV